MRRLCPVSLVVALLVAVAPAQAARIQIGVMDDPGGAAALHREAPFAYRYQYLAGGANTGQGWATWNPDGRYATSYIRESARAHTTPVFTYYMIRQSLPGANVGDEQKADIGNLRNASTMKAYWSDLTLFFKRAAATHTRVILHVEPDMWGYLEQAGDIALARQVAQHVVRLRNRYARNVKLGYHLSDWGTRTDLSIQNPSLAATDRLAAADFARHVRFLTGVHPRVKLPIFLWQIAYARAGVRALLFGGGADGTTGPKTDGGWFFRHVRAYYGRSG